MAKQGERRVTGAEDSGEDLKRIVRVGPAGVLPTVMIMLGLIAIIVLGIALLFR